MKMAEDIFFPVIPGYSQKEIEASFVRTNNRLSPNELFHFSLVLNQNWKGVNIPLQIPENNKNAALIGRFKRINLPSAEISIAVYLIPREVHPSDYIKIILKSQGKIVLKQRELPSAFGFIGDFLNEYKNSEKKIIERTIGIKDGNKIFVLNASMDRDKYNQEIAEEFLLAICSFQLINPTKDMFAEKMKTYYFAKQTPIPIQFLFPESWLCEFDTNPPPNGNSVFYLNKKNKDTVGHISFCSVPGNTSKPAAALFENYSAQLEKNGIVFDKKRQLTRQSSDSYSEIWTILSQGTKDGNTLEISGVVIVEKNVKILVALVGPTENGDIESWAINRRALNVLLDSLKIGEKKWKFNP